VRHWLAKPELMCMQHRAGEHLECHMMLGSMQRGKSMQGFYDNGLFFGPAFLHYRHEELSGHLAGHSSPILEMVEGHRLSRIPGLAVDWTLYPDLVITKTAITKSVRTLISRCVDCLNLHKRAMNEGRETRYRIDDSRFLSFDRGSTTSSDSEGAS
jgi:hypothetical protein